MPSVIDELYQIEFREVDSIKFVFETVKYQSSSTSSINRAMVFHPIIMENEGEILDMNRVLNINHEIFNCNHVNYLPMIEWNYKDIDYTDMGVDESPNGNLEPYIFYGVEVFDNDNQDEVYYLEWDIKNKHTNG